MEDSRRDFLKRGGLASISAAGATLLPSCSSGSGGTSTSNTQWQTDPRWQEARYGGWGGPGVSVGPGPMDGVLLKDYAPRSLLVADETFVSNASYPAVDVHVHHYPAGVQGKPAEVVLADWVRIQDDVGIETSVVLTGATGSEFDGLVKMYLEPYPDRFQLYCGVATTDIDAPDYPERAAAELERCYTEGARGVGEITDKGYGVTRNRELAPDERLHPDDARLDPFWTTCAELNLPVNLHIADHPSAWEAPDIFQERTPIFQQFSQYGENGLSYKALLAILRRTLEKHPKTTFVACHLANQGNDLRSLGRTLDRYPNLSVDISARDYELGRQPRAAAAFLTQYSDRVLFGTDMGMHKTMYQSWWRLLESADEYMVGRLWWPYYGLELPESVLEPLYRGNAKRILNWRKV